MLTERDDYAKGMHRDNVVVMFLKRLDWSVYRWEMEMDMKWN